MAPVDSKPEVFMLEQQQTNDLQKPVLIVEKQDYSGAHEKTDPREIALVKKLDRYIMVRFRQQLILLAKLTSIAHALEHVLAELSGSQCNRARPSQRSGRRSRFGQHAVPDLCVHSLRRLPPWTNSFQHVLDTHTSQYALFIPL
jgi:hypothetical protein